MTAEAIKQELISLSDEGKRKFLPYFFKTKEGQYGYGDKFIGVVVPKQRALVKKIKCSELSDIELLLNDEYHECRLTGLLFLVEEFKKAKNNKQQQKKIFDFYISNHKHINNWDLVDLTAPAIVGAYLLDKDKAVLKKYATTNNLWLQRISIVATITFIRNEIYEPTYEISTLLLSHKHDLIHKAVGWMLREVGKRNLQGECQFLLQNNRYKIMPRTMLRYAIEKFPNDLRSKFLKGDISFTQIPLCLT